MRAQAFLAIQCSRKDIASPFFISSDSEQNVRKAARLPIQDIQQEKRGKEMFTSKSIKPKTSVVTVTEFYAECGNFVHMYFEDASC